MGFGEAISAGFRNYVNFTGRAIRSEYWYWILFYAIIIIIVTIIDGMIMGSGASVKPLSSIVGLAFLLPNLSVAIRRLHDIDKSGWFVLIGLIPLIGWILIIVWACQAGTPGPNRFGPDPLGGAH